MGVQWRENTMGRAEPTEVRNKQTGTTHFLKIELLIPCPYHEIDTTLLLLSKHGNCWLCDHHSRSYLATCKRGMATTTMMRMRAHPRGLADHENEASTEAAVYDREIMMRIHCLTDFPATLSHEAGGVASPWNAASALLITAVVTTGITNGDRSNLGNSQGMPENQTEAYVKPVIKILK